MPASLFKHEPDVSGPEDEVQIAKHLEMRQVYCLLFYLKLPDYYYENFGG